MRYYLNNVKVFNRVNQTNVKVLNSGTYYLVSHRYDMTRTYTKWEISYQISCVLNIIEQETDAAEKQEWIVELQRLQSL